MSRLFGLALALPIALAASAMSGCTVEGHTGVAAYPDTYSTAYVYDDSPGYAIETYPSYAYGNTTVYLVGDRWYYRHGGHWAYYTSEPPALYGYRTHYYRSYGYSAPPAYGAPPAYHGHYAGRPFFSSPSYGGHGTYSAPPARPYTAPPAYGYPRPNQHYQHAPPPRRHH
jgi:hypothetical protein